MDFSTKIKNFQNDQRHINNKYSSFPNKNVLENQECIKKAARPEPFYMKSENSEFFINLKKFLAKFFMGGTFTQEDLLLNKESKLIFISILKKKKYLFDDSILFDLDYLNDLVMNPPTKKRETNLKFVLPKSFKFLKSKFIEPMVKSVGKYSVEGKKLLKNKETYFYQHYFGQIALNEGIPIEKFFIFRNWTHRYNDNIPKTITTETLLLWKKNPDFFKKMMRYLRCNFLEEFKATNQFKLDTIINKWVSLSSEKGLSRALPLILKSIESKGGKMPWTFVEAEYALENTLEVIS
jgi:hypothetical protein